MDFVAAYLHPWDLSERNRVARSGRDYARVEDRWRAKRAAIFASVGVDPVADGEKPGLDGRDASRRCPMSQPSEALRSLCETLREKDLTGDVALVHEAAVDAWGLDNNLVPYGLDLAGVVPLERLQGRREARRPWSRRLAGPPRRRIRLAVAVPRHPFEGVAPLCRRPCAQARDRGERAARRSLREPLHGSRASPRKPRHHLALRDQDGAGGVPVRRRDARRPAPAVHRVRSPLLNRVESRADIRLRFIASSGGSTSRMMSGRFGCGAEPAAGHRASRNRSATDGRCGGRPRRFSAADGTSHRRSRLRPRSGNHRRVGRASIP